MGSLLNSAPGSAATPPPGPIATRPDPANGAGADSITTHASSSVPVRPGARLTNPAFTCPLYVPPPLAAGA
ncbi:MAG TPA: hypothetical protein VND68_00980, partial [Chloroflexia bacterium]|nr:hypothetical protein [Chloroflexia bacterium]